MKKNSSIVYVVDDEEAVCDSIDLLLRSVGMSTRCFTDPSTFLEAYAPEQLGCLVIDVRMPGMNGLEVQRILNERRYSLPVIFITAHGDVPMAVEAMRNGAFDFLQKPFNDDELIRRVQKALEQDVRERAELNQVDDLVSRYATLTPREREIALLLVDGCANKTVALELGISERTVELHRSRIMQKMEARSFAQLIKLLISIKPHLKQG